MKKYDKNLVVSAVLILFIGVSITLLNIKDNKKEVNLNNNEEKIDILERLAHEQNKNNLEGGFPYSVDFENYDIQINEPKLYENYIIFDYLIKTNDGSDIKEDDIYITGSGSFPDKAYFISPQHVLTKIDKDKMHSITTGFIVAREDKSLPINKTEFTISAKPKDYTERVNVGYVDKTIRTNDEIPLSNEGYTVINKKIRFDNIEFEVLSLGNFDFGSLVNIFVGNIDEEKSREISETYNVKLKSGDFEKSYNLKKWIGFNEIAIRKYSEIDKKYNPNSQYDQFYMARMFYDLNKVDRDNMEIYLINNITNDEIRII